mmetsp:Transcript_50514/g.141419  ORF Transcript_50514/g.141419 Transcript_50514/m.141419 type:complete len:216 (+) Transcript_50514:265-912(+)
MSDQWTKDYDKARKNALQLSREIDSQSAKPDARQAALMRGNLAQLRQEVSHLEKSLLAMSQNTQAYSVTKKEVSRRGDILAQLSEKVEGIQDAIRNGVRRRLDASEDASRRGFEGGNDRDVVVSAEQEVANQDEQLDFLHGTVQNIKGMGGNISQEIDLHCRLLGELEAQTDAATNKVKQNRARLEQLSEQSPTCCLWAIICFLSVVLVLLLLLF